ncbi:MAG: hypothetical protein LBJ69_02165 [Holosporales bacterium]|jgi:hypothetical protein|nr:hypothetical protein [Holosporales bacterium]
MQQEITQGSSAPGAAGPGTTMREQIDETRSLLNGLILEFHEEKALREMIDAVPCPSVLRGMLRKLIRETITGYNAGEISTRIQSRFEYEGATTDLIPLDHRCVARLTTTGPSGTAVWYYPLLWAADLDDITANSGGAQPRRIAATHQIHGIANAAQNQETKELIIVISKQAPFTLDQLGDIFHLPDASRTPHDSGEGLAARDEAWIKHVYQTMTTEVVRDTAYLRYSTTPLTTPPVWYDNWPA